MCDPEALHDIGDSIPSVRVDTDGEHFGVEASVDMVPNNCSVLLLDDVGITHINEALNLKEL